jgi:hypothetical protein
MKANTCTGIVYMVFSILLLLAVLMSMGGLFILGQICAEMEPLTTQEKEAYEAGHFCDVGTGGTWFVIICDMLVLTVAVVGASMSVCCKPGDKDDSG